MPKLLPIQSTQYSAGQRELCKQNKIFLPGLAFPLLALLAFALLAYVSFNLIRSGFQADGKAFKQDPSTGRVLVVLSIATSIDAFAVGLSIAIMKVPVLLSVFMIGLVALVLSGVGLFSGTRLGKTFGKRMEILGGLILLGIGIRVVITHILF